jgi:hypothetical protein
MISEWQPIETAPNDKGLILLYLSGDGYNGARLSNIVVGVLTGSGWYSISDGYAGVVSGAPTHWMPLPAPPSTDDK